MALSFYATVQYGKMLEVDDTDVMVSSRDSFYDASYVKDDNIMFAFGITKYDSNPYPIEDPTIGVLKPYYKSWGIMKDAKGVHWQELPTRECTEADLHING